MAFDVDEDILQDFLVEAAEILEQLSEQLVDLEKQPEDSELLNAIFRGFHTVKGGAGFLGLTELVDACHGAENVFDTLRNGQRQVTSELMDVILEALDTINAMFTQVQAREPLAAAEPALLAALHRLSQPASDDDIVLSSEPAPEPVPEIAPEPSAPAPDAATPAAAESAPAPGQDAEQEQLSGAIDDITEDEFEKLLDQLHGQGQPPRAVEMATSQPQADPAGDITDDEFENLLDQLHGQGKGPSAAAKSDADAADETISEDEFEKLLDQLHGQGKGPSAVQPQQPAAPTPAQAAQAPGEAPQKVAAQSATKPAAPTPAKSPAKAPGKPAGASQAETTVRVDTKLLDNIMNMVGELVLVRNRLVSLGISRDDEEMAKAVGNLDVVTGDLQRVVMKTRMQPIKKVFGRFPRVVRDLARNLKKEINLVMVGEETDLDKNLVDALADPLVHLVRNSVDHGIELPGVREACGKPRTGTITLSASQEGDHILLTIRDDGAGMDAEKLRKLAIERGVLDTDAAARMSDQEAYELIFAPGFSTKEQISDISGRGVGMDVVKTTITKLSGSVHIDSRMGVGTTLEIKVPLTLAIMPTLMVKLASQTFALPLACVNEIFHLDLTRTNVVDGQLTVVVRGKAIPLFYLEDWLGREENRHGPRDEGHVVIVQQGSQQMGFVVDALIGQEEVVIKPIGALLHGTPGMAGATITSDGAVALILDVPSMLKRYARRSSGPQRLRA